MNFNKPSSPIVISSGRSQLSSLQENLYLHNIKSNYEEIGGSFSRVDIMIMDELGRRMVEKQALREQLIYQMLGIKDIAELNEKYLAAGGNADFIHTQITDVISEASKEILANGNTTRNKGNEKILAKTMQDLVDNMIDEQYKDKKEIAEKLKQGLGPQVASMLLRSSEKEKKPRMMDKYTDSLANQMSARWRGEILEQETAAVMHEALTNLMGKQANVVISGKYHNAYGKQIKPDIFMDLGDGISVGISAKNYKLDKGGNTEVTLHSAGRLENFYKLVDEMSVNGATTSDLKNIKKIVSSFRTPYFKYHLINQAAFMGQKHIEGTNAGENIINFVKACLPLFIGAQFKIKGDEWNVDFFNISGTLIPVSEVMRKVFYGQTGANMRVGLYSNYSVPWVQMRESKMQFPVEDGDYYSEGTQRIGGYYGQNLYDEIKIGTVHLKLALKNFV